MTESTTQKIPEIIEKSMFGFAISQILFVMDRLGIFDLLGRQGEMNLEELSHSLCLPATSLERLLLASVSSQFLIYRTATKKFSLVAELKPFLIKSSPKYCGRRFAHYENATTQLYRFLEDAIRNDEPQWKQITPDFDPTKLFDTIYHQPSAVETFLETMWALGYTDSQYLCQSYELSRFKHLIDVGGASGSFAISALEMNPQLLATVFDKSAVEPYLHRKKAQYPIDLQSRLNFISGDFFHDPLPAGDAYSLGYILSDWTDQAGTELLTKIYQALPPNGAVLILEKLFNDDLNGPFTTAMMNLTMLLETFGKHRSSNDYIDWLKRIGFRDCVVVRSKGEKHLIVGLK